MISVEIRYFLNHAGIEFAEREWFDSVNAEITKQPGFLAFSKKINIADNILDLVVQFDTMKNLEAWCVVPIHDEFVAQMKAYSVKELEFSIIDDEIV